MSSPLSFLTVIVPSRGRPYNIVEYVDAWIATSIGAAKLIVAVDDDDPMLDEYQANCDGSYELIVGPRLRMGPTLNKIAVDVAPTTKIVGFTGDDHRFRTPRWDHTVVERLTHMGKGIAYGDDLIQGPNLPTAVFMTSNIVETLGYMAPPTLTHLFLDDFWRDLGNATNCLEYMPDIVIEHMHPLAGKAQQDAGYDEVNTLYAKDEAAYRQWQADESQAAIQKIKNL